MARFQLYFFSLSPGKGDPGKSDQQEEVGTSTPKIAPNSSRDPTMARTMVTDGRPVYSMAGAHNYGRVVSGKEKDDDKYDKAVEEISDEEQLDYVEQLQQQSYEVPEVVPQVSRVFPQVPEVPQVSQVFPQVPEVPQVSLVFPQVPQVIPLSNSNSEGERSNISPFENKLMYFTI